MRKRKTAQEAGALKDDANKWHSIDWKHAQREVRRLQIRIAKAVRENRWNKVRSLQNLLTHSFYAKLLAVNRVTSNKGKKTPGVDGALWRGVRAKWRAFKSLRRRGYNPKPLRRIYIPKKNGKKLYQVLRICSIGIRRHVKIKAAANPYLPEYAWYYQRRRKNKESKLLPAMSAREYRAMATT